jgi:hypothetical protein
MMVRKMLAIGVIALTGLLMMGAVVALAQPRDAEVGDGGYRSVGQRAAGVSPAELGVADPVEARTIADDGYTGDLSESEVEALAMALDDEYKAWSVYAQVIADFGGVQPFTSIQRAEAKHIAALVTLFDRYGLAVPVNEWPGDVPSFDTLADACEAGVQAEIDNAALYDELFTMVDNADIIRVFTALQEASQTKHLPAFERCAP